MPNIKSAEKRLRQSLVRRSRNRSLKRTVKTEVQKVIDALEAGKLEEAATQYNRAAKELDQAASKGVIHRNAASRGKSRLSAHMKAAGAKLTKRAAPTA